MTLEYVNHAHNDFIETWLEAGWPGAFLIAAFTCWWIGASVKIWRGVRTPHTGLALAGAVVVGLLLAHSAVDYPLRTPALATMLAFACGLMIRPAPQSSPSKRQGVDSFQTTLDGMMPSPSEPHAVSRPIGLGAGRILLGSFTIATALWLTWACVAQTVVGYDRRRDPSLALSWAPHNADLLARVAALQLDSAKSGDDFDRAAALAQSALKHGPLESRALRVLGLVADHDGRTSQANELMRIAGKRTLRDADTQWWLFDASMRRGDYIDAFAHADAILRRDPETAVELFPTIIDKLADPKAVLALTQRLALRPSWRGGFLTELSRRPGTRDLMLAALAGLRDTRHPATEEEVGVLLRSEIDTGDYVRAFNDWRSFLASAGLAAPSALYNGRFRADAGEAPFNWTIAGDAGAVDLGAGDDGVGLRAVPADRNSNSPLVSELLVLPAGGYRLGGKARIPGAIAIQNAGFAWSLRCAETGQAIGQTEETRAGDQWTAFEATFVVPSAHCAGQWLDLKQRTSLRDAAAQTPVLFDRMTLALEPPMGAKSQ
jgi:tetratricopeptide (TPR) repeat protein